MTALRLLLVGAVLAASGCRIYVHDLPRGPSPYPYPAPRPPEAPPPSQPPPPPPSQDVLRVKEIHADRVYARIIYAKEVKARGGRVGRTYGGKGGKENWGGNEIKAPEVSVEIIYAKEIHADWIEADEIHAKEVKIGR